MSEPWREAWQRIVNRPCNDTAEERRFAAAFEAGKEAGANWHASIPELAAVLEAAEKAKNQLAAIAILGDTANPKAVQSFSEKAGLELSTALTAYKTRVGKP